MVTPEKSSIAMRKLLLVAFAAALLLGCNSSVRQLSKLSKNSKFMSDFNYYEGLKNYYGGSSDNAIRFLNKSLGYQTDNDAAYYILSQIYQAKNDRIAALTNAELAYKYDPKNRVYGLNFAQALQRLNRLDSALTVFNELYRRDSTDTDILLNMSLIYGVKGDVAKSIKLYDDYSAKFGNNELILENKQKLFLQLNQLDSAASIGSRLVELFPEDPRHLAIMADIYANKGNDSLAIDYNLRALQIVPSYPIAQIGLSDAYRRDARYSDYFRVLNDIFKNDEIKNSDKVSYFNQFLENKQFYQVFYPNIDTLINNFVATYPKDTSIYPIYADHLGRMGKLMELNTFLLSKIDAGSKDTSLITKLLELNLYTKRFDTTSRYASLGIKYHPTFLKFHLYKSYALFQSKQYDSTIAVLKSALPIVTKDSVRVDIFSMIGDSYHSLGKNEEAYQYYDKALAINPKSIAVLNNYSYYLSLEGRNLRKALKMIETVLEKDPNNSTYLDTKAWILYKLGRYDEAKSVMRQALIYGGNDNDVILEHYGDILLKLNEVEMAKMYWQMSYDKGNRTEELLKKLNKDK